MTRRAITPAGVAPPFGRYNHAVALDHPARLLTLSGQLGIRPDGTIPETAREQASLAFGAIEAILREAGMDRSHVMRLTAYLVEPDDRRAYMEVRDAWVAEPAPASTLLFVKALALPAFRVEVEAIAAA